MASVGGPFQSGHGPVERAGGLNFVGRARANWAARPCYHGAIPVEKSREGVFAAPCRRLLLFHRHGRNHHQVA